MMEKDSGNSRFWKAVKGENSGGPPPIWMMRQAGRYQSSYQKMRQQYSFEELCKTPDLAAMVTMLPIQEFDFDAAILFSDILFPLELLGMKLHFDPGPVFEKTISGNRDMDWLLEPTDEEVEAHMNFQAKALERLVPQLPHKALLGFVGSPLTLFFFACGGSHRRSGSNDRVEDLIGTDIFHTFMERIVQVLAVNIKLQADAGAEMVAVFDSCAGELDEDVFEREMIPYYEELFAQVEDVPLLYYQKKAPSSRIEYWKKMGVDLVGIDQHQDLANTLKTFGNDLAIQGNFDPEWLRDCSLDRLEIKVNEWLDSLENVSLKSWVCGLGHGVLPETPVGNVQLFLKMVRERVRC